MSILTAENLAKSYKSRKVVSDVSLTVNSNEIVGLLGPNGAGKQQLSIWSLGLFAKIKVKLLLMAKILVCSQCIIVRNVALVIYRKKPRFSPFDCL